MKSFVFLVFTLVSFVASSQTQDNKTAVSITNSKGNAVALYKECGNEINVSVKKNGKDLSGISLSVSAEEGTIEVLATGKFRVVPRHDLLNLTVLANGVVCSTQKMVVINAPLPYTFFEVNGVQVSVLTSKAVVKVLAESADSNFAVTCPRDTSFTVTAFNFNINSGTDPGENPTNGRGEYVVSSNLVDLSKYKTKAGDFIGFLSFKVVRTKWDGRTAEANSDNMVLATVLR